jgi:hypothetical protein
MREFNEQKKLVDVAFENAKLPVDVQGYKVYKALVFHRFFEVLSNAFPLWYEEVNKEKFKKSLYEFMRYGAKSDVMWEMPNEYRKFLKKSKFFKETKYLNDLLWFEWIEVKLMMKSSKSKKIKKFSFKNEYKLSSSACVKKLKYKVFEKGSFNEKSNFYLLAYYDFDEEMVFYREISELLYLFLKELEKKGLKSAIKKIALSSQESKTKVKEFFKTTLEELCEKHVIRIKNV